MLFHNVYMHRWLPANAREKYVITGGAAGRFPIACCVAHQLEIYTQHTKYWRYGDSGQRATCVHNDTRNQCIQHTQAAVLHWSPNQQFQIGQELEKQLVYPSDFPLLNAESIYVWVKWIVNFFLVSSLWWDVHHAHPISVGRHWIFFCFLLFLVIVVSVTVINWIN